MLDDLRNYLQLASGVTEATTSKARDAVSALLSQGLSLSSKALPAPEMMGQVQELADDLVTTSRNNREMLVGMIRAEVDRAVGRMGFVREDELAALRRHVQRLEKQIGDLESFRRAEPAVREDAAVAPEVVSPVEAVSPVEVVSMPEPEAATPNPEDPADPPKKKKRILVVDEKEAPA